MSSIYSFAYGRASWPTASPFTSEGTPPAPSPFPPLRRLRKKYYEKAHLFRRCYFHSQIARRQKRKNRSGASTCGCAPRRFARVRLSFITILIIAI